MRKITLLFVLLLTAPMAFGDQPLIDGPPPELPVTPAPAPTPTPSPTVYQNLPSTSSAVNPGANTGNQQENMAAAINSAIGAALVAAGMAQKPPNQSLIGMGGAALAQGIADAIAAGQSKNTADTSVATQNGVNTPGTVTDPETPGVTTPSNPAFGSGKSGYTDPVAKDAIDKMNSAGYSLGADGVVNPDGSKTPFSAFNSPESMKSAGLDPSAYAQAQKIISGIPGAGGAGHQAGVAAAEGGGAGAPTEAPKDREIPKFNPGMFGLSASQQKQMVAGKTVMFDGEPIGVRGQDIFEMIHVAYEKKVDRNNFILGAPAVPAGAIVSKPSVQLTNQRMPASVGNLPKK